MTPAQRAAWKRDERKVARFFGTTRTPLSGINSKHTGSDTLSEDVFVENKRSKRHAIFKLWKETRLRARKERKLPVVTLTQEGEQGFLIVVHSSHLRRLSKVIGGE